MESMLLLVPPSGSSSSNSAPHEECIPCDIIAAQNVQILQTKNFTAQIFLGGGETFIQMLANFLWMEFY